MAAEDGLHADLTGLIIGAAKRVYRVLGTGFLEKVYQNALVLELRELGLMVTSSAPISVYYQGELVGEYFADLLVEGKVILELKAVEELAQIHEVQLVNYLRATRVEVGLLINFGPKLDVRRKIFTNDRKGFQA